MIDLPPPPNPHDHRWKLIRHLGPDPGPRLRAFRVYHAVGEIYLSGSASLRDVARELSRRDLAGELPAKLPSSLASVQRACVEAEEFFQIHWELAAVPHLLQRTGTGLAYVGLTPDGWIGWQLVRELLQRLGTIT